MDIIEIIKILAIFSTLVSFIFNKIEYVRMMIILSASLFALYGAQMNSIYIYIGSIILIILQLFKLATFNEEESR